MSESDVDLAARLAGEAGRIALELRASGRFEGGELGREGDALVNRHLVERLRGARPGDGLLSEESKDTCERLDRSRVWIIDPIDGTREYGECRRDWAVHVGLAVNGRASIGAVALPGNEGGLVLRSDRPLPVPASADKPRIVISRTRPPVEAATVAEALGAEIVSMGSAGAKAMAVVRGEAEIYLHAGGQHEWDSCAPVAVAMGNGLHCSRLDGGALVYNRVDTNLPDLLICRPEWAERVLAALR